LARDTTFTLRTAIPIITVRNHIRFKNTPACRSITHVVGAGIVIIALNRRANAGPRQTDILNGAQIIIIT